jgi:hypothetical protein
MKKEDINNSEISKRFISSADERGVFILSGFIA